MIENLEFSKLMHLKRKIQSNSSEYRSLNFKVIRIQKLAWQFIFVTCGILIIRWRLLAVLIITLVSRQVYYKNHRSTRPQLELSIIIPQALSFSWIFFIENSSNLWGSLRTEVTIVLITLIILKIRNELEAQLFC